MNIPMAAYVIAVITIMALLLLVAFPGSRLLKGVAVLGVLITIFALFEFNWNPWALAMLAVSPIPFLLQASPRREFLFFTLFMAMGGTFFLFKDESGQPVVNYALAGTLSIVCGQILWSVFYSGRFGKRRPAIDHHQSVVGLIGTVLTGIETHGTGSVEVEGETWVARSDRPVTAGSRVRIVRQDGAVLTVRSI